MSSLTHEWKWYVGSNEEVFESGPFETREIAIDEGRGNYGDDTGFHIVEARKDRIRIADYFDASSFLERVDEAMYDDHGNPDGGDPIIDTSHAENRSLEGMIRAEIDRWQDLHHVVPTVWQFSATRGEEYIAALNPAEDDKAQSGMGG